MKVLFIGQSFGNSYLQYQSLKINYKKVDLIDTKEILPFPWIAHKIFHHISPFIFEFIINKRILVKVKKKYDLIYVKSGELIGKSLIFKLKKKLKKLFFFVMTTRLYQEIKKDGCYFYQQLNILI